MNITPLKDHVLVEAIEEEERKTTKSGIVLPETAERKKRTKGTVVAVGSGKVTGEGKVIPLSVKVGDKVLFKEPWSDEDKFEEDGKKYFLVDEDDILGIID